MKKYQCHKIVEAEPINENVFKQIGDSEHGILEGGREGYKVKYEDGYVSWSPKEAFEKGYTLIEP